MALVLVIDLSLGGDDLTSAIEATRATIEVLEADDLFAVVGFDRVATIITPMSVARLGARANADLANLAPGLGADLTAGFALARRLLHFANARAKHIIVLTAGRGDVDCLDAVVAAARVDGMTVSAVGIGDADRALLDQLGLLH